MVTGKGKAVMNVDHKSCKLIIEKELGVERRNEDYTRYTLIVVTNEGDKYGDSLVFYNGMVLFPEMEEIKQYMLGRVLNKMAFDWSDKIKVEDRRLSDKGDLS